MLELTGKHVVIAGGSGFLGLSLAEHLVSRGARVTILILAARSLGWQLQMSITALGMGVRWDLGPIGITHYSEAAACLPQGEPPSIAIRHASRKIQAR